MPGIHSVLQCCSFLLFLGSFLFFWNIVHILPWFETVCGNILFLLPSNGWVKSLLFHFPVKITCYLFHILCLSVHFFACGWWLIKSKRGNDITKIVTWLFLTLLHITRRTNNNCSTARYHWENPRTGVRLKQPLHFRDQDRLH